MRMRYVAFLRGINLGKRRPPMSELKSLFEELGFAEVETFIASGNVIFSSKDKDSAKLEAQIAQHLEKSLGYRVDTFVRTAEEVAAIGKAQVFPEEGDEGITVHVGFLHKPLSADAVRKLTAVRTKEDEFKLKGRDYYWLCRTRVSESKVWNSAEMKAVKMPTSSMRNITSIRKLIAKHFT
jgi:uncharacterized protein (DUF1697 family)